MPAWTPYQDSNGRWRAVNGTAMHDDVLDARWQVEALCAELNTDPMGDGDEPLLPPFFAGPLASGIPSTISPQEASGSYGYDDGITPADAHAEVLAELEEADRARERSDEPPLL